MGFYRQQDQRVYGDDKYLQLTQQPPSGRGLWHYLLLGPHHVGLPGLFNVGRATLAERLNWPLGRDHSLLDEGPSFTSCWLELEVLGMARADWQRQVIFLPNTFNHECNWPRNSKMLKFWHALYDLIPESPLCLEWARGLRDHCAARDKPSFLEAFTELWNHIGNDMPVDSAVEPPSRRQEKTISHTGDDGAPESPRATDAQARLARSYLRKRGQTVEGYLSTAGRQFLTTDDVDDIVAGDMAKDAAAESARRNADFTRLRDAVLSAHDAGGIQAAREVIEAAPAGFRTGLRTALTTVLSNVKGA